MKFFWYRHVSIYSKFRFWQAFCLHKDLPCTLCIWISQKKIADKCCIPSLKANLMPCDSHEVPLDSVGNSVQEPYLEKYVTLPHYGPSEHKFTILAFWTDYTSLKWSKKELCTFQENKFNYHFYLCRRVF